jgi:hypothetical protein
MYSVSRDLNSGREESGDDQEVRRKSERARKKPKHF